MAEYHVRRSRMPSTSSDDFEDESLDPRIQVELEKLNKASEEINRLELELDDARASFRQTLSESTQKLDVLAKKLGSCVEKARPYYDARVKAKEAHLETQRAALRFERACSMHEAAKEMVQLAEQGYMRREQPSDPAWQEMLNHATMKVNEAEKERNESEQEHERTMIRFKVSEEQVQGLQKDLKRAITKSKPYFEMKARFNQIMEEHKQKVSMLEEDVSSAKSLYSSALRSLEAISDQIHRQRLERRQQQQLGVRGAGVGAECPLPPPSWEKGGGGGVGGGGTLDGRGSFQSLDPLGVLKVSSTLSYGGGGGSPQPPSSSSVSSTSVSSRRRSRNLSGESAHGTEMVEEEKGRESEGVGVGEGGEEGRGQESSTPTTTTTPTQKDTDEGREQTTQEETERGKETETETSPPPPVTTTTTTTTPLSSPKETVLIPGDPLGVIPPMVYTTSSRSVRAPVKPNPSSSSSSSSISHPAFTTTTTHPTRSPPHHPPPHYHHHPSSSQGSSNSSSGSVVVAGGGSRTRSVTNVADTFVSPSMVYANPEQARRPSYRRAVESSQRSEAEEEQEGVDGGEEEGEGVVRNKDVFEVFESRQRSYSSPVQPTSSDPRTRSPPHAIPGKGGVGQRKGGEEEEEVLADGRRHGSAPERSTSMSGGEERGRGGGVTDDYLSATRSSRQKLQGLILRIDPTMDPMRHFQTPPPATATTTRNPATSLSLQATPTPTTTTTSPLAASTTTTTNTTTPPQGGERGEREAFTPTPTHPTPGGPRPSGSDYSIFSKPIIRSASSVSNTGSERSETEFSEVESVSATQSPTKARARLLNIPATTTTTNATTTSITSMDTVEDSSDTESLASTGPMLDDEQVEFLTLDFSHLAVDENASATLPHALPPSSSSSSSSSHIQRNSWSRMSLPPRLSYLEGFLARAKRNSGEFDVMLSSSQQCVGEEGEVTVCEEGEVCEEETEEVEVCDAEEEEEEMMVDGTAETNEEEDSIVT